MHYKLRLTAMVEREVALGLGVNSKFRTWVVTTCFTPEFHLKYQHVSGHYPDHLIVSMKRSYTHRNANSRSRASNVRADRTPASAMAVAGLPLTADSVVAPWPREFDSCNSKSCCRRISVAANHALAVMGCFALTAIW